MEKAFLGFEVEVMQLGDFEDVVDCALMIVHVCTGGNSDVVHVDSNSRAEGFVLEDDIVVDVVHHGLEGCWRIGESEVHDRRFEKSVSGFECCLLFVSLTDVYVVIPPPDVKYRVDMCVTKIADKICDQGEGVLVADGKGVDFAVVLYRMQFAVFLADEEE